MSTTMVYGLDYRLAGDLIMQPLPEPYGVRVTATSAFTSYNGRVSCFLPFSAAKSPETTVRKFMPSPGIRYTGTCVFLPTTTYSARRQRQEKQI